MGILRAGILALALLAASTVVAAPAAAATVPGPPRDVAAVAGDGSARVTWEAPADDGGASVNRYFITSTPGNITRDVGGSSRAVTISGLTNGTAYTFTVRARNSVGHGPESAPSAPVTPATTPGAPRNPTAVAGNRQITVRWDPPASDGGSAVTSYEVTRTPGGTTTVVNAPATTVTVAGLQNGTSYTFTVKARNRVGLGPASSPTVPVTPTGTVPGAPRDVAAQAGDTTITVTWSPPSSTGGSAITGYVVTASPGTHRITTSASGRSARLTGLTNGTAYTVRVAATNEHGTGTTASPPSTVTPYGVPRAPREVRATPGDREATVQWRSPSSDNGAPITSYTVTSSPGGRSVTVSGSSRSATVTGLANGTSYTFRVQATNARGTGPASAASNSVRPVAVNEIRRIAGSSRIGTAIAASEERWETANRSGSRTAAQAVVLARSDGFADALAATPLAARKVGPLLLTPSTGLDPAVRNEIQRILPAGRTVYVLGGTSAISGGTESILRSDGYQVVRLAGSNRYATAVRIADLGLGNPRTQFLVTGTDFPDALAAGAAAARTGGSVLLTDGRNAHPTTAAYLDANPGTRYTIGGQATEAHPSGQAVVGSDRYDTAARVARRFFPDARDVGIASGADFPDALAGSAHVAARSGPLLLVADALPSPVRSYLVDHRDAVAYATVYGGPAVVAERVVDAVRAAMT